MYSYTLVHIILTRTSALMLCFRNDFDEEKSPNLTDDVYLQDIHSISSLLKAYFRDLPNPLLTYQLYDKFAVSTPMTSHITQ